MKQIGNGIPAKTGLAYFIYGILFIIVIAISGKEDIELFSLSIFFVTNLFFTLTLGTDLFTYLSSIETITELYDLISPFFICISLLFQFISSILLIMTMNFLKKKFEKEDKSKMELQSTIRENLNNTKILFLFSTLAIGISAFGLFNGNIFSLDKLFELITGSTKYIFEFILLICVFIFILASYILWKLNNISSISKGYKIPSMDSFVEDYRVLYSIGIIYLCYIPFRILTRNFGIFNITNRIELDWLMHIINIILIVLGVIFLVKMAVDGTNVYANLSSSIKEKLGENIGILIAFIILACLGLLLMPDGIINMFIKVVLPLISLGISVYLTKQMFEMATINNKIVVK